MSGAVDAHLPGGIAIVVGSSGGIGSALHERLSAQSRFGAVLGLGRRSSPPLDLTDEESIAGAARHVAGLGRDVRLIIDASGILHDDGLSPEKSWRDLDAAQMAKAFAVNAIGPALLMKHFLPLLPRQGRSVFATLSARVGSIGDNRLGGWYSYRASKAALNQFVRTAAIELGRRQPAALCVALHPGTVATPLSSPFVKAGLDVQTPDQAAGRLLDVIDRLPPGSSGSFFDYRGDPVPW
ncbi:SDR family NAD(P)-dependent oxidoreductase [Reyranella sp.]|uniref:SDR family NAD(P)-dependent oxidoreductase n=1 Tax=Reyranella sp. TaxID=1929291 RepID=UPI003C7CCD4A